MTEKGLGLRGVAVTTETAITAKTVKTGCLFVLHFEGPAEAGQGVLQNRQNRQNPPKPS